MENLFSIFPEELWLMILKNCECSSLQNLFRAFPQFFTTFDKNFPVLLFSRQSVNVFQKIRSCVKFEALSFISPTWFTAVEHFVDSYPSEYFVFDNHAQIDFRFLLPLEKTVQTNLCELPNEITSKFEDWVDTLKTNGYSLKTVALDFSKLSFSFNERYKNEFDLLVECLKNIKYVRVLSIKFTVRTRLNRPFYSGNDFPELPYLKTLELFQSSDEPITVLEYFHRGYIRKGYVKNLRINNKLLHSTFVEDYNLDKHCRTFERELEFLKYIKQCGLERVTIKCCTKRLYAIYVLWWLRSRKMNPKELLFENTSKKTEFFRCEEIPHMPSVLYIKITDATFLDYKFLTGLTSLEHLHVMYDKHKHMNMFVCKLSVDRLTNLVQSYLYDDFVGHEADIWKEIPTLKSFVAESKDGICKHFVRSLKNTPLIFKK